MDYTRMTCAELKKLCKNRKLKGYSKLKKSQLVQCLQENDVGPKAMRLKSPLLRKIQSVIKNKK